MSQKATKTKEAKQSKKDDTKPEDWPTNPKVMELSLSAVTFPQTSLRNIEGKPPFLRALINPATLAAYGVHFDLPLLVQNGNIKLVLHAWPSQKIKNAEVSIDDAVLKYIGLGRAKKISFSPVEDFLIADQIVISCKSDRVLSLLSSIYTGTVVSAGSAVFCSNSTYPILSFTPKEAQFVRITSGTTFISAASSDPSEAFHEDENFMKISAILSAKPPRKSMVLHGPAGCGKSYMLDSIIASNPSLIFGRLSIPSLLSGSYGAGELELRSYKNRDVVILENAEVLSSDEVSRRIIAAICEVSEHSTLIITTNDIEAFPPVLKQSSRISEFIEIQSPGPDGRMKILGSIISDSGFSVPKEELRTASEAASGFVAGDLRRLVSEAIIDSNGKQINLADALQKVKPSSLRLITLEIPHVNWIDIGGYESVKQKLKESVTLPLENPEAFTRLGIRPPRGVLLYGPPGCSKTLMAKAVATESKMNFIAVKGPELFSKYVGESEKAVASVFKKARNASPSIIFFDEIDAMASKRGSGSDSGSNVTDRVLTQLLTEMDGVMTRFDQSIVVIAATNRPDLLDPALMRPGRFDRLIYVSLPNEDARKEIFKVHISKMKFQAQIDFGDLAKRTDGYSGAEIASVCREAAMNALRETPPAKEVTLLHLNEALVTVTPRTPQSLIKWYSDFEQERRY